VPPVSAVEVTAKSAAWAAGGVSNSSKAVAMIALRMCRGPIRLGSNRPSPGHQITVSIVAPVVQPPACRVGGGGGHGVSLPDANGPPAIDGDLVLESRRIKWKLVL
jgi:hypothetical protein